MSWFSKATGISNKDVKGVVQGAGKAIGTGLKAAAPIVNNIPGLGQLTAPLLAMGGNVLQGHNLGSTLKAGAGALIPGALSKAAGYVAPAISAGISKLGGGKISSALGSLAGAAGFGGGGGGTPTIPGLPPGVVIGPGGPQVSPPTYGGGGLPFPSTVQAGSGGTRPATATGGGGGSRYGAIGDLARDVFSGGKPLTLGNVTGGPAGSAIGGAVDYAKNNASGILAAGSAASGALDAVKASQLRDQALKDVRGSYDERGALRSQAMKGLTSPARPSLSAAFADPGNVYSQPAPSGRPSGGGALIAAAGRTAPPQGAAPLVAAEMARPVGGAIGAAMQRRAIPAIDPIRGKRGLSQLARAI